MMEEPHEDMFGMSIRFSVLTMNIWQWNVSGVTDGSYLCRQPRLIAWIQKNKPDLIALQEARDGYVGKAIREMNAGYTVLPQPEFEDSRGQHHIILASQWPVQPGSVESDRWPIVGDEYPYGAVLCKVEVPRASVTITLASAKPTWKADQETQRLDQAEKFCKFLAEHAKDSLAVIAGDFDDDPESKSLKYLRAQNFKDGWAKTNSNSDGFTFVRGNPLADTVFGTKDYPHTTSRRIDYLFTRDFQSVRPPEWRLSWQSTELVMKDHAKVVSGHYGLLGRLKLQRRDSL